MVWLQIVEAAVSAVSLLPIQVVVGEERHPASDVIR
jgi:hypothetical protein